MVSIARGERLFKNRTFRGRPVGVRWTIRFTNLTTEEAEKQVLQLREENNWPLWTVTNREGSVDDTFDVLAKR